jgi:single-stranded DNA-binding protein
VDYQKIFLIGGATGNGEIKKTRQGGYRYGVFRLALRTRDADTMRIAKQGIAFEITPADDENTYISVRCYGKLAESVTKIKKGTRLFVEGELDLEPLSRHDGQARATVKVIADAVRILTKKGRERE